MAVRVGFRPTLWMSTFESGNSEAAARKNTAEDRSPGTSSDFASSCPLPLPAPRPRTRMVCPLFSMLAPNSRSEEHTSELQSPVHVVCRLLLEQNNDTS